MLIRKEIIMIKVLFKHFQGVLRDLCFGYGTSSFELWLMLGVSILVFFWVARNYESSFDVKRTTIEYVLLGSIISFLLLGIVAICTKLYIAPEIKVANWIIYVAVLGLLFFMIVIPLHCFIQGGHYIKVFTPVFARFFAFAVTLVVMNYVIVAGKWVVEAFQKAQNADIERLEK